MVWPLGDLRTAADTFETVATTDPIAAVLLAAGGLIVVATLVSTGALAAGGLSNTLLGWP